MPYRTHVLRTTFFAAAVAATTTSAFATAPGTRVNNEVTINFEVGGVGQDQETAEVGFVVDRKIDMLVADTGSIVDGRPKQTGRELVFKITNEGNAAQPYDIDVTPVGSLTGSLSLDTNSDALGAGEYRIYISADATLDGGDTVYNPTGFLTADTPDAFDGATTTDDEFHVIIVINIPSDAADDDTVAFSVKATALDGAGTAALVEETGNGLDDVATPANAIDIVFADGPKTSGSGGVDITEDGKHTDNASLTVASAELTITKDVEIVNENTQGDFDCTTSASTGDDIDGAIPGACLEYTITVANGAAASEHAQNVTISDTLPAGVTFSVFMNKTAWTDAAHAAGVITASLDNDLEDGDSEDLVYRVTVD